MTPIDIDALEARAKAATPEDDLLEKLELWWARPDGRPAGPINPDGKEAAELIRSLITRLRAAEAERDGAWQPIETYFGTHADQVYHWPVLVCDMDGHVGEGFYHPDADAWFWAGGGPNEYVEQRVDRADYWMPLPSPEIRALKKEPKT